MKINLPARLEAWDAEKTPTGWAISTSEMKEFVESILKESEEHQSDSLSILQNRLIELVKHLS